MGSSQETFNKKEKEKKKLKKRQDKEMKKEERKGDSTKGLGLDSMIAYVDEYGNLTDTPPDPTKKKIEFNPDDIQINVSRREDMEPVDAVRKGTVSYFNDSKGYGFIKDHDSQDSFFVHINGLLDDVREGDKVTYETERGHKGLNAIKVKLFVAEKPVVEKAEVKKETDTIEASDESAETATKESREESEESSEESSTETKD